MMPEVDTPQETIKDSDTVVSDPSFCEGEILAPPPKTSSKKYKILAFFAAVLCITALALGLGLGLTKSSPPLPRVAPSLPSGGGDGSSSSSLEYQLADSVGPVGRDAFYGNEEDVAFIDPDTDCIHIMNYDSEEMTTPLCQGFEDVNSISLHDEYAVIALGQRVEVWKMAVPGDGEWDPYPNQNKVTGENVKYVKVRNPIIKRSDPSFGKKTAMFQNKIIIASDTHVYLFQKHGSRSWSELNRWRAVGFDMNLEETLLAVYSTTEVKVYDLSDVTITDNLGAPEVHTFRAPIATVVVSEDDVHVVVASANGSFDITHVYKEYITELHMSAIVVGDAILSIHTGCLIDIVTGDYFSIQVEDADDVLEVSTSRDRITVFLTRDNDHTVEIFEKNE